MLNECLSNNVTVFFVLICKDYRAQLIEFRYLDKFKVPLKGERAQKWTSWAELPREANWEIDVKALLLSLSKPEGDRRALALCYGAATKLINLTASECVRKWSFVLRLVQKEFRSKSFALVTTKKGLGIFLNQKYHKGQAVFLFLYLIRRKAPSSYQIIQIEAQSLRHYKRKIL